MVAFNGKEAARRVLGHLSQPEPMLGRTDVILGSSRVFVLPSSSGANADRRNLAPKSSKAEWWRELGDFRQVIDSLTSPHILLPASAPTDGSRCPCQRLGCHRTRAGAGADCAVVPSRSGKDDPVSWEER